MSHDYFETWEYMLSLNAPAAHALDETIDAHVTLVAVDTLGAVTLRAKSPDSFELQVHSDLYGRRGYYPRVHTEEAIYAGLVTAGWEAFSSNGLFYPDGGTMISLTITTNPRHPDEHYA